MREARRPGGGCRSIVPPVAPLQAPLEGRLPQPAPGPIRGGINIVNFRPPPRLRPANRHRRPPRTFLFMGADLSEPSPSAQSCFWPDLCVTLGRRRETRHTLPLSSLPPFSWGPPPPS